MQSLSRQKIVPAVILLSFLLFSSWMTGCGNFVPLPTLQQPGTNISVFNQMDMSTPRCFPEGPKAIWKQAEISYKGILKAVSMPSSKDAWIVGDVGTILVTHDSGKNWVTQTANVHLHLHSIHMLNKDMGWIAGENGLILKTENGGQTWTRQAVPTTNDLNQIRFLSKDRGYAVGNRATFLWTEDGGKSWNHRKGFHKVQADLLSIQPGKARHAILSKDSVLVANNDKNETLTTPFKNQKDAMNKMFFLDHQQGWMVGAKGQIRRTYNGGNSWAKANTSNLASENFNDVQFLTQKFGWIISEQGSVLVTMNFGASWAHDIQTRSESSLNSISAHSVSAAIIVGDNGTIYRRQLIPACPK